MVLRRPDGETKWTKSIVIKPNVKCTVSIIDERNVLTAAHCLKDSIDLTNYTIVAGSTGIIDIPQENFQMINFTRDDVRVHPLYKQVRNEKKHQ